MNLYASLEDLKSSGVLNITATTNDVALLNCLEESSRQIDKDTDRFFYIYETTFYQDGGANRVILDWDVQSITTLKTDEDGDGVWENTFNLTTTSPDAFLYPMNEYPKTRLEINPYGDYGSFGAGTRKAIEITGVFGYGNDWPKGYTLNTGITASTAIASTATSFVATASTIETGMTLRITSSEQAYVSQVVSTTVTIQRAVNGTSAIAMPTTETVYVYTYPKPIAKACLIHATRIYKRRESAYQNEVGNPELGTVTVWKGADPDYANVVKKYKKVKREWFIT